MSNFVSFAAFIGSASRRRKIVYSLNHSPRLFDAPERGEPKRNLRL